MICSDETREKMKISSKNRILKFPNLFKELGEKTSTFWKENPDVKSIMAKKVSDTHRVYKIAKLDYNTQEIIQIFNSKFELKETHPDFYYQAILGCCQQNKNSYKGFKWCYVDKNTHEKRVKQ